MGVQWYKAATIRPRKQLQSHSQQPALQDKEQQSLRPFTYKSFFDSIRTRNSFTMKYATVALALAAFANAAPAKVFYLFFRELIMLT